MPAIIRQPFPIEFVDRGGYDRAQDGGVRHASRHPSAGGRAPAELPRTPLGYSVGAWDGGTLVVETTRLNEPYLNNTGAPMSPGAKLVERFAPSADGSRLSYTLVISDRSH